MKPMQEAIIFVNGFGGIPVLGTDIVSYFINVLRLSDHCSAGSVGSAVKYGKLTVVGTTKINGKSVNLFI